MVEPIEPIETRISHLTALVSVPDLLYDILKDTPDEMFEQALHVFQDAESFKRSVQLVSHAVSRAISGGIHGMEIELSEERLREVCVFAIRNRRECREFPERVGEMIVIPAIQACVLAILTGNPSCLDGAAEGAPRFVSLMEEHIFSVMRDTYRVRREALLDETSTGMAVAALPSGLRGYQKLHVLLGASLNFFSSMAMCKEGGHDAASSINITAGSCMDAYVVQAYKDFPALPYSFQAATTFPLMLVIAPFLVMSDEDLKNRLYWACTDGPLAMEGEPLPPIGEMSTRELRLLALERVRDVGLAYARLLKTEMHG